MSHERPSLLVLVRHAESQRNAAKKGQVYFADDEARQTVKGVPDYKIPLTELGEQQAIDTGSWLYQQFGMFDYAYHSGYKRTEDTLRHMLDVYPEPERSQIKIRMNPFIRERDPGYTYDMTTDEAEALFPYLNDHWKTFGGYFARPPGGESLDDVTRRVYTFLNMLYRDRAGKRILVVTHGGTLRCFRFLLEWWTLEQAVNWPVDQRPHNCGVTEYRYNPSDGHLVLEEYNSVCSK